MITQEEIIETSAGFDNKEQVEALDKKYGLPKDYKDFLLKNDYIYMSDHLIQYIEENLTLDFYLKMLYGYSPEKTAMYRLEHETDLYEDELPEHCLIIGCCWQTELVVLNCRTNEVFIWDHTAVYEISLTEGDLYIIAESFTEFIDKLEFFEEELDAESKRQIEELKKYEASLLEIEPYLLPREFITGTGEHLDMSEQVEELDQKCGLPEDYKKFLLKHDYIKCWPLMFPIKHEDKIYTGDITKFWGLSDKLSQNIISATKAEQRYIDENCLVIGYGDDPIILNCKTGEVLYIDKSELIFYEYKICKIANSFTGFIAMLKLRFTGYTEENLLYDEKYLIDKYKKIYRIED